ncbi:MAG: VOC family protein [Sphingobium sp.]
MIGYVILGTNDLVRAAAFYEALLAGGDDVRLLDTSALVAWGKDWDRPVLAVARPSDGEMATPGHGGLVALVQSSRAQVDAIHARAIALGATDDGAPATRGEEGDQSYYAGYCRDLDGNRLCLFFVGAAA